MISVTNAESNTIINVTVINKCEGPFSNEFVTTHNFLYSGLTIKMIKSENATAVKNT